MQSMTLGSAEGEGRSFCRKCLQSGELRMALRKSQWGWEKCADSRGRLCNTLWLALLGDERQEKAEAFQPLTIISTWTVGKITDLWVRRNLVWNWIYVSEENKDSVKATSVNLGAFSKYRVMKSMKITWRFPWKCLSNKKEGGSMSEHEEY